MQFHRYSNGKTILIQSDSFLQYKELFLLQMKNKYKQQPINQPVNVRCLYYRGDRRRTDLVNLENGTLDLLVEAKILKDDNYHVVYSMDGSRVFYDKDNPRVEIYITSITDKEGEADEIHNR